MSPESLAWIETQKSALVVAAQAYVEKSESYQPSDQTSSKLLERFANAVARWMNMGEDPQRRPRFPDPRVTTSQLRSLLATTQNEPLAVVESYLRYQIGRGSRGWGHDAGPGHELLGLLDKQVRQRLGGAPTEDEDEAEDQEAAGRRLASLLIGFVIREQTYQVARFKEEQWSAARIKATRPRNQHRQRPRGGRR